MIPTTILILTILCHDVPQTMHLPMADRASCEEARGEIVSTYTKVRAITISLCVSTRSSAEK